MAFKGGSCGGFGLGAENIGLQNVPVRGIEIGLVFSWIFATKPEDQVRRRYGLRYRSGVDSSRVRLDVGLRVKICEFLKVQHPCRVGR